MINISSVIGTAKVFIYAPLVLVVISVVLGVTYGWVAVPVIGLWIAILVVIALLFRLSTTLETSYTGAFQKKMQVLQSYSDALAAVKSQAVEEVAERHVAEEREVEVRKLSVILLLNCVFNALGLISQSWPAVIVFIIFASSSQLISSADAIFGLLSLLSLIGNYFSPFIQFFPAVARAESCFESLSKWEKIGILAELLTKKGTA
jgi:ABC-type multidrug transport system fused ATPase/permease subunit